MSSGGSEPGRRAKRKDAGRRSPRRFPLFLFASLFIVVAAAAAVTFLYRPDIPADKLEERYAKAPSRFAEVEGLRIHYRVQGAAGNTGEERHRAPLVLLHGTFASLHTWEGWVEKLGDERAIITLDLPGFGLTGPDPTGDYSTERAVYILNTFLEEIGVFDGGKIHLGGNSLGGRIAWNYALAHPSRCASLILVDAAGYRGRHDRSTQADWQDQPDRQDRQGRQGRQDQSPAIFRLARIPWIAGVLSRFTPKFLFRMNLEQVYGRPERIDREVLTRYYLLNRRVGNRDAFLKRVSQPSGGYPPEQIEEIGLPTLIIWGGKDRWIPPAHARWFHEEIEGSQMVVFPDAGHVPMEEIPKRSAEAVDDFLENLGS